jgi:hypothetical protein
VDDGRPFRGSDAVRAGRVTWGVLTGPGFRRVGSDTYVAAGAPDDARTRVLAAAVRGGRSAVVTGWSACVIQGIDVVPRPEPAVEMAVHDRQIRPEPGLVVRRQYLADEDVVEVDGVRVTTPLRTAFDLATRTGLVDAVVAADGLGRYGGFTGADLETMARRQPGARGVRRVRRVAELMDPRSESPMETRTRLVVVLGGLPVPELQHEVFDEYRFIARIDMAWVEFRVALEYDGRDHAVDDRRGRDLDRREELRRAGWEVIVVTARQVLRRPEWVVARVREALLARGWAPSVRAS